MLEPPVARFDELRVHRERAGDRRRTLRHPDGKHEWQAGPLLPDLSEIVDVRVVRRERTRARRQQQRRIANDEARVVRLGATALEVGDLGVGRNERGRG